ELDDLYRLPFVSDPQLSPDGARVAFVVTTADRERDANSSRIWIVATDGSEPAREFTSGDSDNSPRWSPDGRRLAFVATRSAADGGKPQFWLLPADGGEARVLTTVPRGATGPMWAPDSRRLAFHSPVDLRDGDDDAAAGNRPVVATTVQ